METRGTMKVSEKIVGKAPISGDEPKFCFLSPPPKLPNTFPRCIAFVAMRGTSSSSSASGEQQAGLMTSSQVLPENTERQGGSSTAVLVRLNYSFNISGLTCS